MSDQSNTTIRIPPMTDEERQAFMEKWHAAKVTCQPRLELLPDRPIDADIEIKACLTEHGTWGVRVVFTHPEGRWNREDAAECAVHLEQIWGVQNV